MLCFEINYFTRFQFSLQNLHLGFWPSHESVNSHLLCHRNPWCVSMLCWIYKSALSEICVSICVNILICSCKMIGCLQVDRYKTIFQDIIDTWHIMHIDHREPCVQIRLCLRFHVPSYLFPKIIFFLCFQISPPAYYRAYLPSICADVAEPLVYIFECLPTFCVFSSLPSRKEVETILVATVMHLM